MKTQNFTQKQNEVLTEIYRRLNYFHRGNVNNKLMYLALPSEAKIIEEFRLIRPYSKEIPRALNWYELTEKGKLFFSNYVTKKKLSDDVNHQIFCGRYIKSFDRALLDVL